VRAEQHGEKEREKEKKKPPPIFSNHSLLTFLVTLSPSWTSPVGHHGAEDREGKGWKEGHLTESSFAGAQKEGACAFGARLGQMI
jgi:hypothetical protein